MRHKTGTQRLLSVPSVHGILPREMYDCLSSTHYACAINILMLMKSDGTDVYITLQSPNFQITVREVEMDDC
jgi:hypothetical protein